jgi:Lrp/AsnC family transcriptional regulator for asnA, asnC and gidA
MRWPIGGRRDPSPTVSPSPESGPSGKIDDGIHRQRGSEQNVADRNGVDRSTPLDAVDKQIIEQLQEDGRLPYTRLATAVGLSEAAVRQRVQRLVESGVMQIVAVTDPLTVGFRRMAMIGLRTEGDTREIADVIAAFPEVDYVVATSGSFDVLMEVVCEDDDHLLSLLNDKVRAIPGVRSTETFMYLRLYKQTYAWGTR